MKLTTLATPLFALALWTLPVGTDSSQDAPVPVAAIQDDGAGEKAALEIGRAYLAGISGGDLDDLDQWFVAEEGSSIYENGSNEGSWEHYKEHHLAPEQDAVQNFKFTSKEQSVERCGDGFLVRHVGGFSLEIEGQERNYRAAVSFMLVPTENGPRILHLHWSSRQLR
jgi:SnoaL-like protein